MKGIQKKLNPFHSRSKNVVIQKNTQNISQVPQTSIKSTVLSVGFIRTPQTSQSPNLAQPLTKVKIGDVPNSIFEYTNSNFPLTSGGPVFYLPKFPTIFRMPDMNDSIIVTLTTTIILIETGHPIRQITNQNL